MKRLRWWWCGNAQEYGGCDCLAPEIVNEKGETIAKGPMISPCYSATEEERADQEEWAREACAAHSCEYSPVHEQFERDYS
jgi:hypothetical protein